MSGRLETGTVQCGDDWPGVFIRGDQAMHYAMVLETMIEQLGAAVDFPARLALEELTALTRLLAGANVHAPRRKPQRVELTP